MRRLLPVVALISVGALMGCDSGYWTLSKSEWTCTKTDTWDIVEPPTRYHPSYTRQETVCLIYERHNWIYSGN